LQNIKVTVNGAHEVPASKDIHPSGTTLKYKLNENSIE